MSTQATNPLPPGIQSIDLNGITQRYHVHGRRGRGPAYRGIAATRAWRTKVPRVACTHPRRHSDQHRPRRGRRHHRRPPPAAPSPRRSILQLAANGRITALTIRP